jgi:hypothetical protein
MGLEAGSTELWGQRGKRCARSGEVGGRAEPRLVLPATGVQLEARPSARARRRRCGARREANLSPLLFQPQRNGAVGEGSQVGLALGEERASARSGEEVTVRGCRRSVAGREAVHISQEVAAPGRRPGTEDATGWGGAPPRDGWPSGGWPWRRTGRRSFREHDREDEGFSVHEDCGTRRGRRGDALAPRGS